MVSFRSEHPRPAQTLTCQPGPRATAAVAATGLPPRADRYRQAQLSPSRPPPPPHETTLTPAGDGDGPVRLTPSLVSCNLPFVAAYQAGDGWEVLADPSRRSIVTCLAERPRAVGELADELPISRPAVSQHLKVLKDAGLVTDEAAGTRRVYRLNPAGVAALRDQLDTFWNRALSGYKDVAEQPITDRPSSEEKS